MNSLIRRMTEFVAPVAILISLIPAGCGPQEPQAAGLPAPTDLNAPPPDPPPPAPYVPRSKGSLTFAKDVAPIVFHKCAVCHHSGEIGPFPLVSYADVQKRSKQIVQVTASRFMPPWPAAPGYCTFEGDRCLSVDEIGLFAQWADEGCREGNRSDLPALPEFPHGWKFGEPDLVLMMPEPYVLPADAKDVYRKFVLRVPIKERRYVRAYDFDPGNRKVVHHAMIHIDPTGWSRHLDEQDPLPGFEGTMMGGDRSPSGLLMGWAPGYTPPRGNGAITWTLDPGTDFVLEMHLNGTGKPEPLQSSIALYFTSAPPQSHPCLVQLQNGAIDIPAGKKDYVIEDQYVLPADADAIDCWPHAHYLCRDMQFYAVLPDGAKTWLLRIKDWDFNWQNSYTYAKPVFLPKGTTLRLRLQYDNSAENPRNPHVPPRRVHFGRRSEDEMGDVTLQLLARSEYGAQVLQNDFAVKDHHGWVVVYESQLKWRPDDWEAHYNLGVIYRDLDDLQQAIFHYQEAIRLKPDSVWAHNNLGSVYLGLGRLDDAAAQYTQVLRIDPHDSKAHNNLGLVLLKQGKLDPAAVQFEQALRANAEFPEAETNLGLVLVQRGDLRQAASHFERALKFNPDYEDARISLDRIRESLPQAR
jgi:tetratricopeptide (TPR) repeat protein